MRIFTFASMPTETEISPESNFDEVKFSFIAPTDIVRSLKKAWRNTVLSHSKTAPRIKAMTIYLFGRIEGSGIDYSNEYLARSLDIKNKSQITGYRKTHKLYWEKEKKYRMKLAVAIEYLHKREAYKAKFFFQEEPNDLLESLNTHAENEHDDTKVPA